MKKIEYGKAPVVVKDDCKIETEEMMCYLYLPVKMAGDSRLLLEPRLKPFLRAILLALDDAHYFLGGVFEHYVYLSAKHLYVEPGSPGNRPGWHADGYGSNGDLNYLIHSSNPTEYAIQEFDIPDDDAGSMVAMDAQVKSGNIITSPNNCLVRIDESVVHRVGPVVETGMRLFTKISVSKHRYDLAGNSHNYLFDYDWDMHSRSKIRNCDHSNKDHSGVVDAR